MKSPRRSMTDRFWSHVLVGQSDQCWPWSGYRDRFGHGQFAVHHRKIVAAHRFALATRQVQPFDGACALHHCDNPPCCNPKHLYWGTNADNVRDRVERGRNLRGEAHGRAKLTEEQVRQIRLSVANGHSQKAMAQVYGVRRSTVQLIVSRKRWTHLA